MHQMACFFPEDILCSGQENWTLCQAASPPLCQHRCRFYFITIVVDKHRGESQPVIRFSPTNNILAIALIFVGFRLKDLRYACCAPE